MTGDDALADTGMPDADDRILAGRAADGDMVAFAALVRRYTPMMRAYSRRVLSGTAHVDDVLQDAFLTAWQRLPDLEDPGKVRSWLMRIVSHKAIDRIRADRPHADVDDLEMSAPDEISPHAVVEGRAGIAALAGALDALPPAQRQCWTLREVGGLSYEEIAAELQVPASTVRGLLSRARKHILMRMEDWR